MSKNLINIGVAGDSTTGDDLFTGGKKINGMFSEIFDAFGKQGANPQDIHATGYFQTPPRTFYTFPVNPGSQLNVDTRNGVITVKLPNGKRGEMVRIRDVFGSWKNSPVTVDADGVEKINGSITPVVFGAKFIEVLFVCIDDTPGNVNWTYSTRSLSANEYRLIDETFGLVAGTPITYEIGSVESFTSTKMLVTGLQKNGGPAVTSSEIHLAHDGTTHVYTESSVLSTGPSRVYDIDFSIQSGIVTLTISTVLPEAEVVVRSTDQTRVLI